MVDVQPIGARPRDAGWRWGRPSRRPWVWALAMVGLACGAAGAVEPVRALTSSETFAGAQSLYPALFPGDPATFPYVLNGQSFEVRAYANGNHLGLSAGVAYGLGPYTAGALVSFGPVQALGCQLKPALCPTAGGSAGAVVTLSSAAGGAGTPRIVLDAAGRAVAAWLQLESSGTFRRSLWAAWRTAAGAWTAPQRLESSEADISDFDLAVDAASGRAMVAWREDDAGHHHVRARPMEPGGAWGEAAVIDTLDRNLGPLQVALDATGGVVVVWNQLETGSTWSVWSNRYRFGVGWAGATRVAPAGQNDLQPRLGVSSAGDAVVVWERSGAGLWSARAAAGAAWSTPEQLAVRQTAATNTLARVAVDAQGRAVVVWSRAGLVSGVPSVQLWSRRLDGVWAAEVAVSAASAGTTAPEPRLAVNEDGVVAAAWALPDGTVWRNRMAADGQWAAPRALRQPLAGSPLRAVPDVAIDSARRLTVVWVARHPASGVDQALWQREGPDGTLGGVAVLSTAAPAAEVRLATQAGGQVQAVWTETNNGSFIVARDYTPASP